MTLHREAASVSEGGSIIIEEIADQWPAAKWRKAKINRRGGAGGCILGVAGVGLSAHQLKTRNKRETEEKAEMKHQ